jgi:hypothetical protein
MLICRGMVDSSRPLSCFLVIEVHRAFTILIAELVVTLLDGNKFLYLIFVGVVFSQHLGLILQQLGQQHLGCFFRTTGQQHLYCF